jgi:hypothetical protein
MTRRLSFLLSVALIGAAGFLFAGCKEEGSMEEAGEQADEAMEDAADKAEDIAGELGN